MEGLELGDILPKLESQGLTLPSTLRALSEDRDKLDSLIDSLDISRKQGRAFEDALKALPDADPVEPQSPEWSLETWLEGLELGVAFAKLDSQGFTLPSTLRALLEDRDKLDAVIDSLEIGRKQGRAFEDALQALPDEDPVETKSEGWSLEAWLKRFDLASGLAALEAQGLTTPDALTRLLDEQSLLDKVVDATEFNRKQTRDFENALEELRKEFPSSTFAAGSASKAIKALKVAQADT